MADFDGCATVEHGSVDAVAIRNVSGSGRDLQDALLAALAVMAVRSSRLQADLAVAVRRAGLKADATQLRQALAALRADGAVERVVPLEDGGVLLSVTRQGLERLSGTAHRHVLPGS